MAENNIRRLLERFRTAGGKTIHIHHHSHQEGSPFTAGLPGAVVQEFAAPVPGEAIYIKHVNSSIIGTSLETDLRWDGFSSTSFFAAPPPINASKRQPAWPEISASILFSSLTGYGPMEARGPDGRKHGSEDILSIIISDLHGVFATVLSTDEVFDLLNG